jgi:hypothetical protein
MVLSMMSMAMLERRAQHFGWRDVAACQIGSGFWFSSRQATPINHTTSIRIVLYSSLLGNCFICIVYDVISMFYRDDWRFFRLSKFVPRLFFLNKNKNKSLLPTMQQLTVFSLSRQQQQKTHVTI